MSNPAEQILEAALKVASQQETLIRQSLEVAKGLPILDLSAGMLMRTEDGVWCDYDQQIAYEIQQRGDPIWFAVFLNDFTVPEPETEALSEEEIPATVPDQSVAEAELDYQGHKDLRNQINNEIASKFGGRHSSEPLHEDSLVRDTPLKFDSLDIAELGLYLEDTYGIELEDDELQRCQTLGDMIDTVKPKVLAKREENSDA